jgi:hypothetical protein
MITLRGAVPCSEIANDLQGLFILLLAVILTHFDGCRVRKKGLKEDLDLWNSKCPL